MPVFISISNEGWTAINRICLRTYVCTYIDGSIKGGFFNFMFLLFYITLLFNRWSNMCAKKFKHAFFFLPPTSSIFLQIWKGWFIPPGDYIAERFSTKHFPIFYEYCVNMYERVLYQYVLRKKKGEIAAYK